MLSDEYPNIPQNEKKNFIFKKKKNMTSVEITFEHAEYLNMQNLFLIVKSYHRGENLIKRFYIIASELNECEKDKSVRIFHSVSFRKLEYITFADFKEWFENFYTEDEIYLKNFKYYGFQIEFYKFSHKWELGEIYPKYPWNRNFIFINLPVKKEEEEIEREKKKILEHLKILKLQIKKYRLYNAWRFNKNRNASAKRK